MKCWFVSVTISTAISPRRRLLGLCLLGVGLALGLAGCGRKGPLKPLRPKSPVMVERAVEGVGTVQVIQAASERGLT